jgi:hypothetical protein
LDLFQIAGADEIRYLRRETIGHANSVN